MVNYSRTHRLTSFTGEEGFSNFMYAYRDECNVGFTYVNFDAIIRNYHKKTFALLEIKCKQAPLSYAQGKIFNEIDAALRRGMGDGWQYLGFYILQFENTSFDDGKAFLNGQEITGDEFKMWLRINF
jgi:hypothetical protein